MFRASSLGPLDAFADFFQRNTVKVDKTHRSTETSRRSRSEIRGAWFFCLFSIGQFTALSESPIPAAWPRDHYTSLAAQSPFAVASAAPPIPETRGSFAANWFVTGLGNLNGKDFVSIKARDLSTQFSLYGDEPRDGVSIVRVIWVGETGKSTVVLRKGHETAEVAFNESEIRSPATTAATKGSQPGKANPVAARGNGPATTLGRPAESVSSDGPVSALTGRPVPPQVARWMSKPVPPSETGNGFSFVGGSAGAGTSGASISGGGAAPVASISPGDSTADGSVAMAGPSSGAVVDFGDRSGSAAPVSPLNARPANARSQIPPKVAQWLTPSAQQAIVQWRTELAE